MQAIAERRPICGVLVDPGQFLLGRSTTGRSAEAGRAPKQSGGAQPQCLDRDESQVRPARRSASRSHLHLVPPHASGGSSARGVQCAGAALRRKSIQRSEAVLGAATRQPSPLVLIIALVVAALTVCVVGLTAANAAPRRPLAATAVAEQPYVVQPGDSLWSIARSLQPSGDVRMLVHLLEQTNGVVNVDAGSTILVP